MVFGFSQHVFWEAINSFGLMKMNIPIGTALGNLRTGFFVHQMDENKLLYFYDVNMFKNHNSLITGSLYELSKYARIKHFIKF